LEPSGGDLDLVRRLAAGDAAAWQAFVERYQRLVFSRVAAAARELHAEIDPSDAEDLCAEVFAQLVARDFAYLRHFEGRSTLATWLSVVTRRICLRQLASRRRTWQRESASADRADVPQAGISAADPLAALITSENRQRLAAGMSQLDGRQRTLVQLFYLDGLSYKEIGQRLGMPVNSVGPTLKRAQEKLKTLMNMDEL
jgi:RNA polymerase sigma-70 factor (ECF subfamily)